MDHRLTPATRLTPLKLRVLIVVAVIILGIPAGFVVAHAIRVPVVKSLDEYTPAIITRIYDRQGIPFAEYSIQRRILVGKRDMAPMLVNAIIATEDADFYKHGGINPKAIARAAVKDILARRRVEGASTITQQVAKQLFLTRTKSWSRKINEAFLAVDIEKNFTKDQILELYANLMYLGHGAYGVEAASRLYFGKHAKDLTVPEAAMIAGLMRSPNSASPISFPKDALKRRNHVLRRMLEERYITGPAYQQAVNSPIVLGTFKEEAPKVGAYFSEEIRQYIERSDKYGVEELYKRGLKVFSTLDLRVQVAAEAALQRGLRRFDHRRGFRRPSRNLVAEGIDPLMYKDPSWSNDGYGLDKLYPAVVLGAAKDGVTVRLNREQLQLPPTSFVWTGKKTMDGILKRGDLV